MPSRRAFIGRVSTIVAAAFGLAAIPHSAEARPMTHQVISYRKALDMVDEPGSLTICPPGWRG